jgi:hypothetical protein
MMQEGAQKGWWDSALVNEYAKIVANPDSYDFPSVTSVILKIKAGALLH